jgi:hypothetical protein
MRGSLKLGAVGAAAAALCLLAVPAHAGLTPPLGLPVAPPSRHTTRIGSLTATHRVVRFHGGIPDHGGVPLVAPPVTPVCVATCRAFSFVNRTTDPFLVQLRDTAKSQDNGWNLYVYGPDRHLIGAANGIGADGQAVEVSPSTAGVYTIQVTFTYAYSASAAYRGEVRSMAPGSWTPAPPECGLTVGGVTGCFELPVLEAVPAHDLHVDGLPPAASTPLGFPFPFAIPTPTSCYADETVQTQATRCLRFTSTVRNVGGARLDIQVPWLSTGPSSGFLPGQCQATQEVHTTDGRSAVRPAGECMFHPAHAHFHYKDLVGFSLHRLNADGTVGSEVGKGLKESFCLADDEYFGFGTPGPNGPRTYVGQPGCNVPGAIRDGSVIVQEGVTPGWGDVYTWDTPGQFIDISNVGPGRYVLVERTNPSSTLLVAGDGQRCSATELVLTPERVRATKSSASIACP